MSYQELTVTSAVSLGGTNKKTGKANPTSIEGYYLGCKEVPDNKKKSGKEFIYTFKTAEGLKDVWGKTNLNRKMQAATIGAMTLATWTGKTQKTPNGEMQLYSVKQDLGNVIDAATIAAANEEETLEDADFYEETALDADTTEAYVSEPAPARATAPKAPTKSPTADQQARVRAALAGKTRVA